MDVFKWIGLVVGQHNLEGREGVEKTEAPDTEEVILYVHVSSQIQTKHPDQTKQVSTQNNTYMYKKFIESEIINTT